MIDQQGVQPFAEGRNPYAAPEADLGPVAPAVAAASDLAAAEAVRRAHLGRERWLRGLGWMWYGLAPLWFGALVGGIFMDAGNPRVPRPPVWAFALAVAIYAGAGTGSLLLGRGLRRLRGWARRTTAVVMFVVLGSAWSILLVFGLFDSRLGAAVGAAAILSVVPGVILYLVTSARARTVCTPEYRAIVARTPHLDSPRQAPWWVRLLILFVIVLTLVKLAGFVR